MENVHLDTEAMMRIVEGKQAHLDPEQRDHVRVCALCRERFEALVRITILIKEKPPMIIS